jgi:hypothetical protein
MSHFVVELLRARRETIEESSGSEQRIPRVIINMDRSSPFVEQSEVNDAEKQAHVQRRRNARST